MTWSNSFCAIDTETTGFNADARILEISVVTYDNLEPVNVWSQLLCPTDVNWDDPNVQKALDVNKIDPAMLKGKPAFADILPDLLVELSVDVWAAHNAEFDVRMMNQEFARVGRPPLAPNLLVCTKNLSAHLRGVNKENRLQDVAPRYGVKQEDAHRAEVDARACGDVLVAMVRKGELPLDRLAMSDFVARALVTGGRRW